MLAVRNYHERPSLLSTRAGMTPAATDFIMSAYHPLGTARLAATGEHGVCDSEHRVFGWQGLTVMDGSVVPSSLGANPQITIMSLAARAASRLADRILKETPA